MNEMISVLVADDHPIVRRGLRSTLGETPDIRVVEEAVDGPDMLKKARGGSFDIILLDLSMPGMSGFDVLKQLMIEQPESRVLILSTFSEKQYAIRCLRAGARGYLTKESAATELVLAIRRVHQGRKYVSSSLAEHLVGEIDIKFDKPLHEALSDREFQILCLFGQGKNVTEIAKILNLSVPTISTYRSRILNKMNLETTAHLIVYVIEHRLMETTR